jgi:uncharacterized protein (DUF1501 family)
MLQNRRDFLKSSMAAGSLVSWGLAVPGFLPRTAAVAATSDQPGARDTILVVVQLTGGNDGLNTVIPYADPEYARLRPTLQQAKDQVRKIDSHVGLHPSLTGLADLLQEQALCVVQGVGYPNPSQSHFRSMDIWQSGSTAEDVSEGWLGRALRQIPSTPSFHLAQSKESSPLALSGAPVRVPTLAALDEFQLQTAATGTSAKSRERRLIEEVARRIAPSQSDIAQPQASMLEFVQRTAVNTYESSRRLQEIGKNYQAKAAYPNTALANHLKLAAQLIDADLGARIFYVAIDGFDTHANQAATHASLLRELSEAMTAFYKDMAARGHKNRILMMTFSEFGRRAGENASKGTDHGSAAPMFLVGGRVKAGVVGRHPSLSDLDMGNLKHHADFLQVYAAILDNWLGVSSREVLGRSFAPAPVLATGA